ncbi:hypothetical protein MN608_00564 [Microdochium nivale]|nr:hypothetical protein MN608_00564 [Microdochium nivale]
MTLTVGAELSLLAGGAGSMVVLDADGDGREAGRHRAFPAPSKAFPRGRGCLRVDASAGKSASHDTIAELDMHSKQEARTLTAAATFGRSRLCSVPAGRPGVAQGCC